MVKYADLHFAWLTVTPGGWGRTEHFTEAEGCLFWCPKCHADDARKDHPIVCLGPSFPPSTRPGGRWRMQGTGTHDLTLTGHDEKGSSVQLTSGCQAHFFVTGGEVVVV